MHQQTWTPARAVPHYLAREFGIIEPLLLETDRARVGFSSFGLFDRILGWEVGAESTGPFCAVVLINVFVGTLNASGRK